MKNPYKQVPAKAVKAAQFAKVAKMKANSMKSPNDKDSKSCPFCGK